jgi:hypothetical protein
MMKLKIFGNVVATAIVALFTQVAHSDFIGGIPSGWTCTGNCGVDGDNGDVTLSPLGNSKYGYVSTLDGLTGVSPFNLGSATDGTKDGSKLVSSAFTAAAGDNLKFHFNYVTSDGSGFADYGWARLLNASDKSQAALLFTARTKTSGNIIPGQGMPPPDAAIPNAPIIVGTGIEEGPQWSALGEDSGRCFDDGCGYTGWVLSSFNITSSGSYLLEFGVTDWDDEIYSSGLAFDGITVGGKPIDPPSNVPVPAALWLFGSGILGLFSFQKKYKKFRI